MLTLGCCEAGAGILVGVRFACVASVGFFSRGSGTGAVFWIGFSGIFVGGFAGSLEGAGGALGPFAAVMTTSTGTGGVVVFTLCVIGSDGDGIGVSSSKSMGVGGFVIALSSCAGVAAQVVGGTD